MNETLVDIIEEGLAGLKALGRGQHLRPRAMALAIIAASIAPERAQVALLAQEEEAHATTENV